MRSADKKHVPDQRPAAQQEGKARMTITDNRPAAIAQRKLSDDVNKSVQRKKDNGLPDQLRSGIEQLSGMPMDHVKVHYNSSKPAQLQALAYAQGSDIHLAPGQEEHLPHEAWHIVQQKAGRVKPTTQMKGVNINDNHGLEKEADVMGAKAMQLKTAVPHDKGCSCDSCSPRTETVQQKPIVQKKEVAQLQCGFCGTRHKPKDCPKKKGPKPPKSADAIHDRMAKTHGGGKPHGKKAKARPKARQAEYDARSRDAVASRLGAGAGTGS